jgi:hypothetical protein
MQYLYAYLDYGSTTSGLGYGEISKLANLKTWTNIQANAPSPTGDYYRDPIAGEGL